MDVARATGLEPATSGVTGRHSNQLSYARTASRPVSGGVGGLVSAPRPVKQPDAAFPWKIRSPSFRDAVAREGPRFDERRHH